MEPEAIVSEFERLLKEESEVSHAVAALKLLLDFMRSDSSETVHELEKKMKNIVSVLTTCDLSVTSIMSACELFIRFITLTVLDHRDFKECKKVLSERGADFLEKVNSSRNKVAKHGAPFIKGKFILVHSHSRVVYYAILEAHNAKKNFHVYVTESAPDYSGRKMHDKLTAAGVSSTLILDSAMGYMVEKVDMVLFGAEGIAESGGIINKIGTYPIAICAKTMNKPVYVFAESFKFVHLFPLNQRDLPRIFRHQPSKIYANPEKTVEFPLVDYTPPAYITSFITDLGPLTPSAACDELSKLYL